MEYKLKRSVKLKDNIKLLLMFLQFPVILASFLVARLFYRENHVWLVGEMKEDAKDNGFAFFKYLNEKHPKINSYYYIDENSEAAQKVKLIGKTVNISSFRHMTLFFNSDFVFSTHDGYPIPFRFGNWREFKILYGWLVPNLKYVFLNHGINKDDDVKTLNYKRTRFDYFVTTTNDEFKYISNSRYCYPKGNVVQTGLARYDLLLEKLSSVDKKKQIVYMPTWRYYLADVSEEEFKRSTYFKRINSLLNNKKLNDLINHFNIDFYFFPPHHEIQNKIHLFRIDNTEIKFLKLGTIEFSDVILSSSMVITDFSSVVFDFAYMSRKVLYYQFDIEEYRRGQYKKGYFDYNRDGFGPILSNESDLINIIESSIKNNFKIDTKYLSRINHTFRYRDTKNCERLFNILTNGI